MHVSACQAFAAHAASQPHGVTSQPLQCYFWCIQPLKVMMHMRARALEALVGQPGFGSILPLAASGPGEPLPSAAVQTCYRVAAGYWVWELQGADGWRAFYTTNLDWFAEVSEDDKRSRTQLYPI
eukprot:scaffold27408_cov20-Tisochrysis_lutea.AAC.1